MLQIRDALNQDCTIGTQVFKLWPKTQIALTTWFLVRFLIGLGTNPTSWHHLLSLPVLLPSPHFHPRYLGFLGPPPASTFCHSPGDSAIQFQQEVVGVGGGGDGGRRCTWRRGIYSEVSCKTTQNLENPTLNNEEKMRKKCCSFLWMLTIMGAYSHAWGGSTF